MNFAAIQNPLILGVASVEAIDNENNPKEETTTETQTEESELTNEEVEVSVITSPQWTVSKFEEE